VRVVGARAVRRPCPRRACAAWAVSARRAIEPGVARRSDRDTVHGIKETKVPHGGVACSKKFPLFPALGVAGAYRCTIPTSGIRACVENPGGKSCRTSQ
jgi:hypothetical protein